MLPFRKIIAPTDFSPPARAGIAAAVEMAEHQSAELILVYAIPRLPLVPAPHGAGAVGQVALEEEIRESAEKAIGEMVENLAPSGVTARHRILSGDPAEQIVAAAKEEDADLIVMATHGETGWRRFVSGSVAEKVVRLAECPVLAVRGPERDSD
jgi:nucleotide-binding universal stress UspA family protein